MRLSTVIDPFMGTNVYIFYEGDEALIVDPATDYDLVKERLDRLGVRCTKVVLTHCHYDHTAAAHAWERNGATVYVSAIDATQNTAAGTLAAWMGQTYTPYRNPVLLNDGDVIEFGGQRFEVLLTPGHTKGGICLRVGRILVTGDTLFCRSYGRTDFPGGSMQELTRSVRRLFALEGDYTVYAGHEMSTTLEEERNENPIALA